MLGQEWWEATWGVHGSMRAIRQIAQDNDSSDLVERTLADLTGFETSTYSVVPSDICCGAVSPLNCGL